MEKNFWIKAWQEGRTGFHQRDFHPKLSQYFPLLTAQEDQKILVPLCGKTKDLLFLKAQKLKVHGVELHQDAVEAFFSENSLSPVTRSQDSNFITYQAQGISISCGDFFMFEGKLQYDLVYDRASLVALPKEMRREYADTIKKSLRPGGKYLLIVYLYDQLTFDGPPFSISDEEIHDLYQDQFSIKLIESGDASNEGPRLSAMEGISQNIYILEKKF